MSRAIPLIGVSGDVLRWARERTGEDLADVAAALGLRPERLKAWEEQRDAPSYAQLESLAARYRRPVAVFFFPDPPHEETARESFRTLPDVVLSQLNRDTRYALRLGKAMQVALAELTGGANPSDRQIFRDLRADVAADPEELAQACRTYLGVTLATQASWTRQDRALSTWRDAVQDSGVFVFKRSFKQASVSGFCINHSDFPVIYLNNSTSLTRQTFTLFHELAHILLGINDLAGDWPEVDGAGSTQSDIESFCNRFAGELLVPGDALAGRVGTDDPTDEYLQMQARYFSVSPEVLLRRLAEIGEISEAFLRMKLREIYRSQEAQDSATSQVGERQGGSYYNTQMAYLGDRYIALAVSAFQQGRASPDQFADYLNMKPAAAHELHDRWLSARSQR